MKLTNWINFLPIALAIAVGFPVQEAQAQTIQPPEENQPNNMYPTESPYNYYMRLGYGASQRGEYETAAKYFKAALYARPNDRNATIAYWNAVDTINQESAPNSTQADASDVSDYDRYMHIGYEATEQGNYQTALINFKRALNERPGDYYASQAIRNVQTYIINIINSDEQVSQQ